MNDKIRAFDIKTASLEHLGDIISIIQTLQLGFMSRLPRSIIFLFFRNVILHDAFSCRVVLGNNKIVGFYTIITDMRMERHAPFLSSPFEFMLRSIMTLTTPFIFLHYFFKSLGSAAQQRENRKKYDAELIYIAAYPSQHGSGIGRHMLADIKTSLTKLNRHHLGLEYYVDDVRAAKLYQSLDHDILGDIELGGRKSVALRLTTSGLPDKA